VRGQALEAFYGLVIIIGAIAVFQYLVSIFPFLVIAGLGALFISGLVKLYIFASKKYNLYWQKNHFLPELTRSVLVLDKASRKYCIPVRIFDLGKEEGVLRFVCPQLKNGSLDLQPEIKDLRKIDFVKSGKENSSGKRSRIECIVIEKLSSPVKEIYRLESEIQSHRAEIEKLEKKLELAQGSSVYSDWAETYVQKIDERKELILLAESIHQECTSFIKEVLIGKELSEADLDLVPDLLDKKIELEQSYLQASDKYQSLKDEVEAYSQLRKESPFSESLGEAGDRPPLPSWWARIQ